MLLRLAGIDPTRLARLLTTPLRDCCAAYEATLRAETEREYAVQRLMWAMGCKLPGTTHKQGPAMPAILEDA